MVLPSRDLIAQLRAAFAEPTVEVEDLADADPRKHVLRRMGDKFTAAVHFLRSEFPNESIRRLMATVWDLVGHRIVPLSHGPTHGVWSLSFCAYVRGGRHHAVLMVPDNWLEQMKKDPVYETGAIVFVGSQAVDFYNDRVSDGHVEDRSRGFEAEYLLTVKKLSPSYKLNDYQVSVLEQCPKGIATPSLASVFYEPKPFAAPTS